MLINTDLIVSIRGWDDPTAKLTTIMFGGGAIQIVEETPAQIVGLIDTFLKG